MKTPTPTPEIPTDGFSQLFRNLIEESARCAGVNKTMPTINLLSTFSATFGRNLSAKAGNLIALSCVFTLIGSGAGSRKSTIFNHFAKPFQQLSLARMKAWEASTKPKLLVERLQLEKTLKVKGNKMTINPLDQTVLQEALRRLQEIEKLLKTPTLYICDCTAQLLETVLAENNEFLYVCDDEATNAIANLRGRWSNGQTEDGAYLKLFDQSPFYTRRKERISILHRPAATINWYITTKRFRRFISDPEILDGGLLSRFFVYENSEPLPGSNLSADPFDPILASRWNALLKSLVERYHDAETGSKVRFTTDAVKALQVWVNRVEARLKTDLADMKGQGVRWKDYAARLALLVHASHHLDKFDIESTPITQGEVDFACKLMDWQIGHQEEIWHFGREDAASSLQGEVERLLQKHEGFFTSSQAQKDKRFRNLFKEGGAAAMKKTLQELADNGKLFVKEVPGANGKGTVWYVQSDGESEQTYRDFCVLKGVRPELRQPADQDGADGDECLPITSVLPVPSSMGSTAATVVNPTPDSLLDDNYIEF